MVIGLPSAGKSTFSRYILNKIENAILIQSDVIRHQMFYSPEYTAEEHGKVFSRIKYLITDALINGKTVIYDSTGTKESDRKMCYKIVDDLGVELKIYYVSVSDEVARSRILTREYDENCSDARGLKGIEVYDRMLVRAVAPSRPFTVVNGELDASDWSKL